MIQEIRDSDIPIYPLQPGDLLRRMPPKHHHAYEFPDGRLLVYQPHAHILVTLRSIDANGFGLKQREWNSPVLLNQWRQSWERTYNGLLAAVGSDERVTAKAKKKAHRERLAADGISPDSLAHPWSRFGNSISGAASTPSATTAHPDKTMETFLCALPS